MSSAGASATGGGGDDIGKFQTKSKGLLAVGAHERRFKLWNTCAGGEAGVITANMSTPTTKD